MGQEKMLLQKEKSSLQRTVTDLAAGVERINREKVQLESQLEMEEEGIVNRMNRWVASARFEEGMCVSTWLHPSTGGSAFDILSLGFHPHNQVASRE